MVEKMVEFVNCRGSILRRLFFLFLLIVLFSSFLFAITSHSTNNLILQVDQHKVADRSGLLFSVAPLLCRCKGKSSLTYPSIEQWTSTALPQHLVQPVPSESQYASVQTLSTSCNPLADIGVDFYVLKSGKWVKVCTAKATSPSSMQLPGAEKPTVVYTAQCFISSSVVPKGNAVIKVCSEPKVLSDGTVVPAVCQYVPYYNSSLSNLPTIIGRHVSTTSPACLLTLLLVGLLLASMYYSGQNPLSLLDITIANVPKPTLYTAPYRPMGAPGLFHSVTFKGVKGNITRGFDTLISHVLSMGCVRNVASVYEFLSSTDASNKYARYLAAALIGLNPNRTSAQAEDIVNAVRTSFDRVFNAVTVKDAETLNQLGIGFLADEFNQFGAMRPTMDALTILYVGEQGAYKLKGRVGGNLTGGGGPVGKAIDRAIGYIFDVPLIGLWAGGIRDAFVAGRFLSGMAKSAAASAANIAMKGASKVAPRTVERIEATRFGEWVLDYSDPVMGKMMDVDHHVERMLRDSKITFDQEMFGSVVNHILFKNLDEDTRTEVLSFLRRVYDIREMDAAKLDQIKQVITSLNNDQNTCTQLRTFFELLDERMNNGEELGVALRNLLNDQRFNAIVDQTFKRSLRRSIREFDSIINNQNYTDLERLWRAKEFFDQRRQLTQTQIRKGDFVSTPLLFAGTENFDESDGNNALIAFIMKEYTQQFLDYRNGCTNPNDPTISHISLEDIASMRPFELALLKTLVYTYGPPRDNQFFSPHDVSNPELGLIERADYFRAILGDDWSLERVYNERWIPIRDFMFYLINDLYNGNEQITSVDQFFDRLYVSFTGEAPSIEGGLLPREVAPIQHANWKLNMKWLWLNSEEPVIEQKRGLFGDQYVAKGGRGLATYSAVYQLYANRQFPMDPAHIVDSLNGYYNKAMMFFLQGGEQPFTSTPRPFTDYAVAYFRPRMYTGFEEEVSRYTKVYLAYIKYYRRRLEEDYGVRGSQLVENVDRVLSELGQRQVVTDASIFRYYDAVRGYVADQNKQGVRYSDIMGSEVPFVSFNETMLVPYVETLEFSRYDALLNNAFQVKDKDGRWRTVDMVDIISSGNLSSWASARQQLTRIATAVNENAGIMTSYDRDQAIKIIRAVAQHDARAAAALAYEFCQAVGEYTIWDHFEVGEHAFIRIVSSRTAASENLFSRIAYHVNSAIFNAAERFLISASQQTTNPLAGEVPLNEILRQSMISLSSAIADPVKYQYYSQVDPFLRSLPRDASEMSVRERFRHTARRFKNFINVTPLGTQEDLQFWLYEWFNAWLSYISRDPRGGNMMTWGMGFAWDAYYHGGGHAPPHLTYQALSWPANSLPRFMRRLAMRGNSIFTPGYTLGKWVSLGVRAGKMTGYRHPSFYNINFTRPDLSVDPIDAYQDPAFRNVFSMVHYLLHPTLRKRLGAGGEELLRGMSSLVRTFAHYNMNLFGLPHHDEANPQHSLRTPYADLMMDPRLAAYMHYNDIQRTPWIGNDGRFNGDVFSKFNNFSYIDYLSRISNVRRGNSRAIPHAMKLERQLIGYNRANWMWITMSPLFAVPYFVTSLRLSRANISPGDLSEEQLQATQQTPQQPTSLFSLERLVESWRNIREGKRYFHGHRGPFDRV